MITGIKDVTKLRVGDTLTDASEPGRPSRCPATARSSRWSSAGSSRSTPTATRTCATRSRSSTLNDAALSWEPETSDALGFGFRCGFLGLLHMDIVRERLEREYDLELLATMPNVRYEVDADQRRGGRGPQPDRHARPGARSRRSASPTSARRSSRPTEYVGAVMELCQERRGDARGMHYLSRRARAAHATTCRSPRSCSTSSTS